MLIPNRDSPNGYPTVMPAELQSVTFVTLSRPHKTLTMHKLACSCFAAIFGHQYYIFCFLKHHPHLPCYTCCLMRQTLFSVSFHHTLPVHTENTLLQNFLAPALGSFTLEHMHIVVPYPLLSFLLCTHNHPL